jgi:hypothetical protein
MIDTMLAMVEVPYSVIYDDVKTCFHFTGIICLNDRKHYQAIMDLVDEIYHIDASAQKWNIKNLQLLDSAGMGQLYHFVLNHRTEGAFALSVEGDSQISWQQKFLPNLQKMNRNISLRFS